MEKSWLYKGRRAYRMKNYDMALDCYEKAIAEGDTQAMYLEARMYESGTGVPKSICKARALFKQAAEEGHKEAANALAMLANPSYIQRCVYVYEVCKLREKGKYREAMEEFLFLVEESKKTDDYTGECMYWIGMMYKLGQGVLKDEVIAEEWLRKAIEHNSGKALKELKMDEVAPEVVCEDNCAKTTAYVDRNIRASENIMELLTQLASSFAANIKIEVRGKSVDAKDFFSMLMAHIAWEKGTKVDISAEGEDAEEAVRSIADLFYSGLSDEYLAKMISQGRIKRKNKPAQTVFKEFDENEYLNRCMVKLADIRKKYNLDTDTLQRAKQNPWLVSLAELVLKGYTEQGILELKKELPVWEPRWNFYDDYMPCVFFSWLSPEEHEPKDPTTEAVDRMSRYYDEKCSLLSDEIKSYRQWKDEIERKNQLAAAGDVKTIIYLGKLYEKGAKWCKQDKEKARQYYKQIKDAWDNILAKRYEEWLDKAVRDSGFERIGMFGREYIDGTFRENAQKHPDAKYQREVRWLNEAMKAGDGWAAFTKGNICYYGYGRWKNRKKEAYNYYIKAKDSIYAWELEKMRLERIGTSDYPILAEILCSYEKR